MSGNISYPPSDLGFDDTLPVTAGDDEIRAAVAEADLPSLLAALAVLTGDETLIAGELQPPLPPMRASIAPQGGMDAGQQALARDRAVAALCRWRDAGCPDRKHDDALLDRVMDFVTKGQAPDYGPLLRHEIGLPEDLGAPQWRLEELAPGRHFRVAVIGAGLAGVAASYRLAQAGIEYEVFEKKPDVGGVWWANSYPGCRLDTPNFAYSYTFAQKSDWPQQFSTQPEILAYVREVARRSGILDRIRFGVEVQSLAYDDGRAGWTVRWQDEAGEVHEAEFDAVVTAVGQLDRPAIPDVPGLSGFKGRYFHSATWPKDVDLSGKRVAVVGTGASAYQIVPAIAGEVSQLTVVQRNAPWMLPTQNYHEDIPTGMAWLLRHVPGYGRWFRFWQFWIATEGRLPLVEVDEGWDHPVSVGAANEALRQECIANLRAQLADRPDLVDPMTPNYAPGAKRMLRDNGVWANALRQPHVRLVTAGLTAIDGNTLQFADGTTGEADIIVFATGFQAADYLAPMKVTGRGGRDLHEEWAGDARAYVGITVPGYPNLFMMAGPNTSVVVNGSAIFSMECAISYTLSGIRQLLETGHAALDCRTEPFERYNEWIDAGNLKKAWGAAGTTSWYKNSSGRASQTWPYTLKIYWDLTRELTAEDYEFIDAS